MTHQTTEEILVEYGVELGYGEKRKALAEQLESQIPEEDQKRMGLEGMDVGGVLRGLDLKMVCDHVRDHGSAKTSAGRIYKVLSDRNLWGPLLADLREFHRHRLDREAKSGKRKQEPGKGMRDQDKDKQGTGTASFFGLTEHEYQNFKWKWTVADWFHRGHDLASLDTYMEATRAEVDECIERFPKGKSFDECLAEYTEIGKTDASPA